MSREYKFSILDQLRVVIVLEDRFQEQGEFSATKTE